MDGKLWRFGHFQLLDMWFYNIPNYVAGSPNSLQVPREVAQADGLNIRAAKAGDWK